MKQILSFIFIIWFVSGRSQSTLTLPYCAPNVMLDKIQSIGGSSVIPKNLIVKDFDNNGFVDVLVADVNSKQVIIYNNVNGSFVPTPVLSLNNFGQFNSIDAGKIDGDALPDLVITDSLFQIFVFRNTSPGAGVFSFALNPANVLTVPPSCKSYPSYVKVVNLNNDAFEDIVLAVPPNSGPGLKILAYRNGFQPPSAFSFTLDYVKPAFASTNTQTFAPVCPVPPLSVINPSMDMSFGDFDASTFKDMFITYQNQTDSVLFLKNTCSAPGAPLTFSSLPRRSPGFLQTWSVKFGNCEMADIDGDGKDDAICLISAVQGTALAINGLAAVQGTNILGSPSPNLYQPISTGTPASLFWPNDFKIADIDNDGNKDLVCINNTQLWIYFGGPPPNPPFVTPTVFTLTNVNAAEIVIDNFDRNNLPDIIFKPWGTQGTPQFIPNYNYSIAAVPANTAIGICAGQTATASLLVIPPISIPHSVDWFLSGAPPIYSGVTAPVLTTSVPGSYFPVLNIPFFFTPTSSCTVKNYPKDSIYVQALQSPTINIFPLTQTICSTNGATLTPSASGGGSFSFSWVFSGTVISTSTILALNSPTVGAYTVIGTDLTTSCTASQSAIIDQYAVFPLSILVSKNKICVGDSASLSVSAQSFTWSNGSHNASIVVKPIVTTQYSVAVNDFNGCSSSQTVSVEVDGVCDFKVYTLISPNSDHYNDVLTIENISKFPNNHVDIYNRWGKRMVSVNGYNNETNSWPGPDSKDIVPSTYFYVIDLGDGSPKIKGWLEIIN